ncbi:hypothetical protein Tco_0084111 [Tanacetum coccineum]
MHSKPFTRTKEGNNDWSLRSLLNTEDQIRFYQEVASKSSCSITAVLEVDRGTYKKKERSQHALIESGDNIQAMIDAESQMRIKITSSYTLKQLKGSQLEVIKDMFDKAFKRVNIFVDYKIELVEGSEKRAEDSTKKAGTELEQKVAKKQKIDDAKVDK